MPAFDLQGKMTMDGSSVSKETAKVVKKTKVQVSALNQELKQQFKQVGTSFLTGILGAVGFSAIKSAIQGVFADVREISNLSSELNITGTEAQLLARHARDAGKSISELTENGAKLEQVLKALRSGDTGPLIRESDIERIKEADKLLTRIADQFKVGLAGIIAKPLRAPFGGVIVEGFIRPPEPIDEEEAARLQQQRDFLRQQKEDKEALSEIEKETTDAEQRASAAEARLRKERLTDAERLLEIEEQITELRQARAEGEAIGDPVLAAEARQSIANLELDKLRIEEARNRKQSGKEAGAKGDIRFQGFDTGSLARLGGFTLPGASSKRMEDLERETNRLLVRTNSTLDDIRATTKEKIGL